LLLFEPHVTEPHQPFELGSNALAKIREGDGFDVECVGAREVWIGFLVFAVLFERDWSIFGDDELRAVLKSFEFTGDSPESGFDLFLSFEYLAPDFESD
jgi:hypothetical protein